MKYCGLFYIARLINKKKIRIICYHGISVEDEHQFIPSNFIKFETMKRRIENLKDQKYNFITLEQAVTDIKNKTIKNDTVVVTFDDGFQTILDEAFPWLIKNNIPTTAYITTYYSQKPFPIFRICVQYLFWKTTKTEINVRNSHINIRNHQSVWNFISDCEKKLNASEMNEVLNEVQSALNMNLSQDLTRSFSIINEDQITELENQGINIELHTHRHHFPLDYNLSKKEIVDNRNFLSKSTSRNLKHFCYPSGIWDESHFKVLSEQKISSATTCELGLANSKSNLLALPRIIESEAMTQIQFDAEILGIGDWLRFFKKRGKSSSKTSAL